MSSNILIKYLESQAIPYETNVDLKKELGFIEEDLQTSIFRQPMQMNWRKL